MNTERKSMQHKVAGDTGRILAGLGLEAVNPGACSGKEWHAAADAPLIDSVNPATGEVIARVRAAGQADYERVMTSAAAAFAAWREVPAPRRGEAVRLVGDALRAKKDLLGSLVSLEMGKIKVEGDGEVQEMIDMADFAVGQSRMLYGLAMHSERPRHRMYEQWHPLGVVGIISAFNFPVAVWSWNAFIAAVCGDVSVWKPSHHTPLCSIAVQKICQEVIEAEKLPPIFQLFIPADNALASRFVDDRRVALVSFTGSTGVGRRVGERVAARLGRSLLELGGNNAIIVDESANLDLVVPSVLFGAVGTAGQRCTTTRRLLVHETRIDEIQRRLVASYKQVRIGDPLDPKTLMGPLVGASAVRQYEAALDDARKQGGEITLRRPRADWARLLRRADDRARPPRHAGGQARDLCADPVPDSVQDARRGDRHAQRHGLRPVVGDLHRPAAARRALPVRIRQRLRHREREHRYLGRRDRRRIRRRKGHRRRSRGRFRFLEGLHAPPDEHDQLLERPAARAGHQVRRRLSAAPARCAAGCGPVSAPGAAPGPARRPAGFR